ncbi:GH1 family beta-glucosidase [Flavobacterium cyanobacteriorum]|uniref:GH1 family beta-glucosidase n=1 Tax=Flavobacterium cyanobacteriorum TaxID=2022802 RepID=UPI0037424E06
MDRSAFGNNFNWGVATAAFQIEGGHDADGKGPSIWDDFTSRKKSIKSGHDAHIACDFYNCYKKDLDLVKEINILNFRFSLSWPRIIPTGLHPVNQKGIDYYNRVIDYQLEQGIAPWVTLYHWDLPLALEQKGGWTSRDVVSWFTDYTQICADNFGDRVKNWMIMNEPSVFTGAGYFLGIHAPGRRGLVNFLRAVHHATLATAEGARVLRSSLPDAHIGTTFSCTHIEPATIRPRDIAAAKRVDTLLNRVFIEPLLGLGYPEADLPVVRKINRYILPGDEKLMPFDFDFIGLQCYTREVVKSSLFTPYIGAALVNAGERGCAGYRYEVGSLPPPSLYYMLKKFGGYNNIKNIIVTENGAAFPDRVENGSVNDTRRAQYLQDHMAEVLKAKQEGVNVNGYFVWTLTDNFEWAEGYNARFGLVHVDFETQQRTIKQSGLWLRDFLKG